MMRLLRKLMIDCDTSSHYCDKLQYNDASLMELFHYKMHVFVCKICKKHSALNTRLSKACDKAKLVTMPIADKAALKVKLEKEIGN